MNMLLSINGTLTILNGIIEALNKCSGIDVAGTVNISTKMEITSEKNPALHLSQNGHLNISGGKVTTGNKAISTLNANGGVINISGTAELISTATDMAAVEIKQGSSFVMTGGSIISEGHTALNILNTAQSVTIGSTSDYGLTEGLLIQGKINGITSAMQFNFYGGMIKGVGQAMNNLGHAIKPEVYSITQGVEDNYKVAYLTLGGEYVVAIGENYFSSLQSAIDTVPKDNTQTVVKLLKNINEAVEVKKNQNIKFNLQNYQILNTTSKATIANQGTVTIYNGSVVTTQAVGIENTGSLTINGGLIDTTASNGAINNQSSATLVMTGGRVTARGNKCKQAIYNNGGTATISGNAYLYSESDNAGNTRATVHNLANGTLRITGGTVISKAYVGLKIDNGTVTIGDNTDSILKAVPEIRGATYGVMSNTKCNYYDGILKGITAGIDKTSNIVLESDSYEIQNDIESIEEQTYKTISLKNK